MGISDFSFHISHHSVHNAYNFVSFVSFVFFRVLRVFSSEMKAIILNCDCGEGTGDDAAILPHVGAANIACGGHAGDAATMRATLRLCKQFGVSAGAHPGYPDREHFGRVVLPMSPDEVQATVLAQMQELVVVAKNEGMALTHVKPHGALYNHAAVTPEIADAIASAIAQHDKNLVLVGLAGSALIDAGARYGLRVMGEAFADRAYEADGTLRNRALAGALIEDDEHCLAQVLRIAQRGEVIAHDGSIVKIDAQTICLHSDTAGAVRRAAFLHEQLQQHGIGLTNLAGL